MSPANRLFKKLCRLWLWGGGRAFCCAFRLSEAHADKNLQKVQSSDSLTWSDGFAIWCCLNLLQFCSHRTAMFSHRLRLTEPKAKAQATFSQDKHAKNICRGQPSCALWTKTPPRLLVVTHSDQGMWKVLWSPRNNPEHMQMGNYTNNINKLYNIIHIQRTSLFAILPCMVLPTYCLSFSMLNLPWWPSRHCVEFYDFYVLQVPGSKSI
jgi:hypothetical protein